METFDIDIDGYEYTVIPGEDGTFMILAEGVEYARVKPNNDRPCGWEVIDQDVDDEDLDEIMSAICDKIESHYT